MTALHEALPARGPGTALAETIRAAIPALETDRLRLRAMRLGDFPVLMEIVDSPRGVGIGAPMSREDAWFDFTQMAATWLWRGHGWWTVTDRADGSTLGFVGIGFEPGDCEPELGYVVTAASEGRGIAAEACRAALAFARDRLGLMSLVSYIHLENARSVALAQRLGAVRDEAAEARLPADDPAYVYRHHLSRGSE